MSLKLMYITNEPDVALIAEAAGVDRIFVDMEYMGKSQRQGGMNTVQNHHTPADVREIKKVVTTAQVMCRINPIHDAGDDHGSTEDEIEETIAAGADILMLPFFKTVAEVKRFLDAVNGRVRTLLLVETPEAAECIDGILALPGIDEVLIGLNDMSLGYGKKFMFELLADGTVERLCNKFRDAGIPYGFGGITGLGQGQLPAENIILEHYRLGSTCVILSRSFCNSLVITDRAQIKAIFDEGVKEIRDLETECGKHAPDSAFFRKNREKVVEIVAAIAEQV